nr:hypothetical protein BaRGS_009019 [Batillaria attramentaria]
MISGLPDIPSRDSINCNHITKFTVELSPPPELGSPRTWNLSGATKRVLNVASLLPFTEYCASVYFYTDGGFVSPRHI